MDYKTLVVKNSFCNIINILSIASYSKNGNTSRIIISAPLCICAFVRCCCLIVDVVEVLTFAQSIEWASDFHDFIRATIAMFMTTRP